jgi:hypothetical protein
MFPQFFIHGFFKKRRLDNMQTTPIPYPAYPTLNAIQRGLRQALVFLLKDTNNLSAPGRGLVNSDKFETDVWVVNNSNFCPYNNISGNIRNGSAVDVFPPIRFDILSLGIGQSQKVTKITSRIVAAASLVAAPLDEIVIIQAEATADLSKVRIFDTEKEYMAVAARSAA